MSEIVVHHLNNSRSQRVLWTLEELGLDYEIRHYTRDKGQRAPESLRAVHPLGKSPVVTIDGLVYAESANILETLVESFGDGSLRPEPGTAAYRQYRYWMHYAEGSLATPLIVKLITTQVRKSKAPFFLRPILKGIADKIDGSFTDREIETHFGYLEAHLTDHAWFTGEAFTVADIQMSFGIEAGQSRGADKVDRPHLRDWLSRIHARPAYQRALERGGPYAYA